MYSGFSFEVFTISIWQKGRYYCTESGVGEGEGGRREEGPGRKTLNPPPLRWKPIDKAPNWKTKKQCVLRDTEGKYHAYQGKEMKTFASVELVVRGGAACDEEESWPACENLQAASL